MAKTTAWSFLDEYRGKYFNGFWPTLPETFRISVARYGNRPCFTIYEGGRISLSYRQALERIEAVARYLRAKGIKKGMQVAVSGKNSPEWAIAYLGVLFAGATVVPIDYQLKNEEIEKLMKVAECKIAFIDEEKFDWFKDRKGLLKDIVSLHKGGKNYIYDIDGKEAKIEEAGENDLAAILFTSGTTGIPKGVMLSHQNLVADCYLSQSNLNIFYTDVFYALLPIHHSYTMQAVFIESLSVGAETVFGKKMVTSQILKDLKEAKITMFLGVPLLFNKVLAGIMRGVRAKGIVAYGAIRTLMRISGLIKKLTGINPGKKMFKSILEKASLSTIRICISGGGPLAPSIFKMYNELGIDFVQGYGLTETSPIITLNPIENYKETSVGKIVAGVQMRIVDPDERGVGEIVVKGPMVMQGYYNLPEETAEVFTEEGWFKTGDLGYMDSENYLYLTGRAKNLIVTEGGKNVYPEEIENEFQLYDEIEQILVRGFINSKHDGAEGIEALVYPNRDLFKQANGEIASEADISARILTIIAEVNSKLLPYQRIDGTKILSEAMEMTTTKKIKRNM